MRSAGIISEYNPFHNGHKYHVEQTRMLGYDTIIAAMSGNITQRGTFACVEKQERVKAALYSGVDLCVEIPFPWACASAQDFAVGGISVLAGCGVDAVSFGAETDNTEELKKAAEDIESAEGDTIKENIRKGMTYANALSEAVNKETRDILSTPNNLLGVEYIRAINKMCPDVIPVAIKRTGVGHDSNQANGEYSSASMIRKLMREGKTEQALTYMPKQVWEIISGAVISDMSVAERALLNSLRNMTVDEISVVRGVSEGLENRIAEAAKNCLNFSDVAEIVKTKRYTLAKIRRVLMNCLVGTDKSMPDYPPYIRVLGFNKRGREVLANIKKDTCILTKPSDYTKFPESARRVFETEIKATELFALSLPPSVAGRELRYTPVVI